MPPVTRVRAFICPDWTRESSYCDRWGCPDSWCLDRWVWEFQKRKGYFEQEYLDVKLLPDEPYPAMGDFDNRTGLVWHYGDGRPWHDGGGVLRVDAADNHVLVRFDMNRPLAPQIEKAAELLEATQVARVGKKISANFHQRNFFAYLRLLDGRHMGASWSQLSVVLPDHVGNRSPQAARDFHGQAKALCFKV